MFCTPLPPVLSISLIVTSCKKEDALGSVDNIPGLGGDAWAPGAIDAWIPLEEGTLTPKTEIVTDESGFGVISAGADHHVTKTWSETTGKGVIRPTSFGYLLLAGLGTASTPTLSETGVYVHDFTVKNDNNHPTMTIIHDDATQEEQALYNMVDTLSISGEAGDYLRFDTKITGKLPTNTTGNTPAFLTANETPFLVSRASIKFASNIAGLSGATAVPVQNFTLNIEKNLQQIFSTLATGTEALDFASQHNQDFRVSGDFEIVYDNVTYRDLAIAGTKQAIEISITGRNLIGATKYETLVFQIASSVFTEWDKDTNNDSIVTQSFGFDASYKLTETKMITASLTNTKATIYA